MRIPVGDEGKNVVDNIGAPSNYLLPCYIGIGKAKKRWAKSWTKGNWFREKKKTFW